MSVFGVRALFRQAVSERFQDSRGQNARFPHRPVRRLKLDCADLLPAGLTGQGRIGLPRVGV